MLNTRVGADPASCRAAGQWLGGLAGGMRSSVDAVERARTRSRECWTGATGDAFRDRMGTASREADRAASATESFGMALRVFADDMDTVHSRMNLARQVAHTAGLPVNDEGIGEPTGMEKVDATKATAYQEATEIVTGARGIEARAHEQLASSVAANARDWSMKSLDALTGAVGALYGEHLAWTAKAAKLESIAEDWERVFGTNALSTETRLAALGPATTAETRAEQALEYAGSNHAPIKFLPGWSKRAMILNPGDQLENVRYLGRLSSALEKVPYVGLGLTGLGILDAGLEGQSVPKAAIKGGAEFAGGILGTEGVLAGAELIGIAGGPVTAVAVLAGIGVAYGVGYVVDHWGDDIADGAKEAASGLYHAGQTVSYVSDVAVDEAGHAVNEGIHKLGHALGHIF